MFNNRFPKAIITTTGIEAHGKGRSLHLHAYCYSKQMLHFTRASLNLGCGFHAHLQPITHMDPDVLNYIQKYDHNGYQRDLILAQNYATFYNLFEEIK